LSTSSAVWLAWMVVRRLSKTLSIIVLKNSKACPSKLIFLLPFDFLLRFIWVSGLPGFLVD
jgi:hypothetical protein